MSKPAAETRRKLFAPSSRTWSVKRTCIFPVPLTAFIFASNVAPRAAPSSAGVQSTVFTEAAWAAAGKARTSRVMSRTRRISTRP